MDAHRDATVDPALEDELTEARRAADYFRNRLDELEDDEFAADSLLPGWTRAHVVAHVGYNAHALARLMRWAETGIETPMYASEAARDEEIEAGAALDPGQLHYLFADSQDALDHLWQRATDAVWSAEVKTRQDDLLPARATVWLRARELWLHAIDLNSGAGFGDLPEDVLRRLLADIEESWARNDDARGLALGPSASGPAPGVTEVSGPLPELTAWAVGRARSFAALRFTGDGWNGGEPGNAPAWL
ncbi:hypothetical protein BJH93_13075 [Kocuria polaris]|nr:hypothetical protein [Kocuria polaris]